MIIMNCPKCGSNNIVLKYIKEVDKLHIKCVVCGFEGNIDPLDKKYTLPIPIYYHSWGIIKTEPYNPPWISYNCAKVSETSQTFCSLVPESESNKNAPDDNKPG